MGDKTHLNPSEAERSALRGLDFYTFINYDWQKTAYIEPFESTFSVSDEIENRVETTLFQILRQLGQTHPHAPMSRFVQSILKDSTAQNDMADIQHISNMFDCLRTPEDVGKMIGALNRIECNAPLSFVVANDRYKVDKRCVYIYEPKLGLPEKHFYRKGDTTEHKEKILLAYTNLLKNLGAAMNVENLERAVSLEVDIVKHLSPENDRENIAFTYRPQSLSELEEQYTAIPWRSMMEAWGVPSSMAGHVTYIVTNRGFTEELNRLFRSYPMETWGTWMRAQLFLQFMKYLQPPFDTMYFQLFGAELQGVQQKMPKNHLMLNILKEHCPQSLGREYVKRAVSDQLKPAAIHLVKRIQGATLKRIAKLDWMTTPTKQKAAEKCKAMLFQVAFPKEWHLELPKTIIDENRMLRNIWNLSTLDTDMMMQHLRSYKINEEENWEDGVFEVNAYYYSDKNMMVVPAGILQTPFYDLKKSDAWNLGGIGAAIGHEITHGFDDDGRMYDKSGVMKNWWSDTDLEKYVAVTKDLVKLFNKETYMGGKVNGQLTLSENIADLGGVAIALEALEETFMENKAHDRGKRKKALQEFFTSYAVSWRNKDRPKKARQSLILDRHAPAPIRVNLIVRQFAEFYEAFDVTEKDPGYIPVDQRIQLW
jgi:putative endopeptidase